MEAVSELAGEMKMILCPTDRIWVDGGLVLICVRVCLTRGFQMVMMIPVCGLTSDEFDMDLVFEGEVYQWMYMRSSKSSSAGLHSINPVRHCTKPGIIGMPCLYEGSGVALMLI
jgi:hypothetical protein